VDALPEQVSTIGRAPKLEETLNEVMAIDVCADRVG
jgi:hypothetical protein